VGRPEAPRADGQLAAAGCRERADPRTGFLTLVSTTTSEAAFTSWGWRIPFLCSLVLVAIGLYIRLQILETPMFAEIIKEKSVKKRPSADVIRKHPKEIILSALIRMSEQMPFYVVTRVRAGVPRPTTSTATATTSC
jgi:MFS family permease